MGTYSSGPPPGGGIARHRRRRGTNSLFSTGFLRAPAVAALLFIWAVTAPLPLYGGSALTKAVSRSGLVALDGYKYYQLGTSCADVAQTLTLTLASTAGNPDLFVSTATPFPTATQYMWSSEVVGSDVLNITAPRVRGGRTAALKFACFLARKRGGLGRVVAGGAGPGATLKLYMEEARTHRYIWRGGAFPRLRPPSSLRGGGAIIKCAARSQK